MAQHHYTNNSPSFNPKSTQVQEDPRLHDGGASPYGARLQVSLEDGVIKAINLY